MIEKENVVSTSGEETNLFFASGSDYFDSSVNATELWNIEEGVYPHNDNGKYIIRDALLNGYSDLSVTDEACHAYSESYKTIKDYSADQQASQAAEIVLSLPSLAFGVDKYKKLYKASKFIAYGGVGATLAGGVNGGPSSAFGALFGYGEMVYGGVKCAGNTASCWVAAPLAFDGLNNTYKAVFVDYDTREGERSLYSRISKEIVGYAVYGRRADEIADLAGFGKNMFVSVFQPKNADKWAEWLLSSGFGAQDSHNIISKSWSKDKNSLEFGNKMEQSIYE